MPRKDTKVEMKLDDSAFEKATLLLDVTVPAERPVTVLHSKTGRVTPIDRLLEPLDNKAVMANRKFPCRYAWNPRFVRAMTSCD
jgi:hypothetical protein